MDAPTSTLEQTKQPPDDLSVLASFPLLEQMQTANPLESAVKQTLRNSGPRLSTAIVVGFHLLLLVTGAVIAASVSNTIPLSVAVACAVSVIATTSTTGRFRTRMVPDMVGQITRVAGSVAAGAAIPFLLIGLFEPGFFTDARSYVGLAAALFALSLAADWLSACFNRRMWAGGTLRSRAVLVGSGSLAKQLAVELRLRKEYGVDLVGVVETVDSTSREDLLRLMVEENADRLVIAPVDREDTVEAHLITLARYMIGLGVPVFVVPRLYQMGMGLDSMSPDRARGYPLVRVQRASHPSVSLRVKRFFDVAVSGIVLLLSSPLYAALAVAVKFSSPGPVLFRQERVGQQGAVFQMLKFRSMRTAENEHAERSSIYRVTRVGKFLRNSSLDELPQFWNVFRGDMSLVGARPERVAFVEEGLTLYPGYVERHRFPMGLTGLAQIAGLRGEDASVAERVKFDNLYIDQWSMGLDLQIMAKTVFAVMLQTRYRRRERELENALSQVPENAPLRSLIVKEPGS